MLHVKRALRVIACRKCGTPLVETLDPCRVRCELPALTPTLEALSWLAGRRTYSVFSLAREQQLVRRFCTRETARSAIAHIAAGTRPDLTILAAHDCPGPGPGPIGLPDWRPSDRASLLPAPRTPALPEEPPF
jgi:hypothetical protein